MRGGFACVFRFRTHPFFVTSLSGTLGAVREEHRFYTRKVRFDMASRKRVRPLDPYERKPLNVTLMDVYLLHDEAEYCLKWPDAPLTAFLKRSTPHVMLAPPVHEKGPPSPGDAEVIRVSTNQQRRTNAPTYVLNNEQREHLETALGPDSFTAEVELVCEEFFAELERTVAREQRRGSLAVQQKPRSGGY